MGIIGIGLKLMPPSQDAVHFLGQQAMADLGIHRSGGTNILPTEKFKISMSTESLINNNGVIFLP